MEDAGGGLGTQQQHNNFSVLLMLKNMANFSLRGGGTLTREGNKWRMFETVANISPSMTRLVLIMGGAVCINSEFVLVHT